MLFVRDLTPNQTLVLLGDNDQRWDVDGGLGRKRLTSGEIVLERWTVQWVPPTTAEGPELSVTYKKSIVVFRSLFTLTRLLPAWKLRKRLAKSKLIGNSLKVNCRINACRKDLPHMDTRILLADPVVIGEKPRIETHDFHNIETPAGKFCTRVEYRSECNFRIDDSEALLSSQFLTSDRTVGSDRPPSSLSSDTARRLARSGSSFSNNPMILHASGSNQSINNPLIDIRSGSSLSLMRPERRPSATFIQPFKTPSLSASPSIDQVDSSPRSLARTPSSVSIDRLNARGGTYSQVQRNPSSLGESTGFSLSGSPRNPSQPPQLIKRYSSSFGQRSTSFSGRRRPSQASDSAIQPESGGSRGSSRSPSTLLQLNESEDDDLAAFVKLLDSRKPLTGSQFKLENSMSSKLLANSTVQRTKFELSQYQELKDSHAALTESLIQSVMLHNTVSSQTGYRKLSPSIGLSHTNATSHGVPVSPHTPTIPSRLSESSVIPRSLPSVKADHVVEGDVTRDATDPIARAVDIPLPLSPRITARTRSSSFNERNHNFTHETAYERKKSLSLDSGESHGVQPRTHTELSMSVEEATFPIQEQRPSSGQLFLPSVLSPNRNRFPSGDASSSTGIVGQSDTVLHHGDAASGRDPVSTGQTTDDDELFFAMSDLHLKFS